MASDALLLRRPRSVRLPKLNEPRHKKKARHRRMEYFTKLPFFSKSQVVKQDQNIVKCKKTSTSQKRNCFLTQLQEYIAKIDHTYEQQYSENYVDKRNFYESFCTSHYDGQLNTIQLDKQQSIGDVQRRIPMYQHVVELAKDIKQILANNTDGDIQCFLRKSFNFNPERREIYEILAIGGKKEKYTRKSAALPLLVLGENIKLLRYQHECSPAKGDLSDSAILPEQVRLLDALYSGGQEVDLTGCGLKQLPNFRLFYRTLRVLDLSWNRLTFIPPEICSLQRLEVLKLRKNEIEHLPEEIASLHRLRNLDLSHCMLQSLPHRFFELHRLEELDLSYNLIAVLDSMLGKLKHLTFVNLEGNDLKGICPGIVRLSCQQLTKLRLDLNPMIHPLPGEISFAVGHVQRLQTLAGLALNAYVSDLKRALSLEMDGLWKQKVFNTALTDEIDDLQSMRSRMQSCVYKMTCGSCCWCSGVRLCDEMQVPWQNVTLAGYRSVPVIFNCCRQSCAVAASKCTPDDFAARFCSTLST